MSDKITPDTIKDVKTTSSNEEASVEEKKVTKATPKKITADEVDTQEETAPEKSVLVPDEMLGGAIPSSQAYKESLEHKSHTMKQILAAQPKVLTYIPPDNPKAANPEWQFVGINGYPIWIMKGVFVEVPMQVAEMIKESHGLTYAAGKDKLVDSTQAKIDALSK